MTDPTPHDPDELTALADLLDQAADAVVATTAELRVTFWSAGASRLYGYRRDEAIGRDARELLRADSGHAGDAIPLETLRRKGTWAGDVTHITKDERPIQVEGRIAARTVAGELRGLLFINRDVTERRALDAQRHHEQELINARVARTSRLESLGHMAGGIAHEFNSVTAAIADHAAAISDALARAGGPRDAAWQSDVQAQLGGVQSATQRAGRLTQQLLAFANHEAMPATAFSLNNVIDAACETLRHALGDRIELELSLAPGLRSVVAPPGRLEQMLMHVATNAREAMRDGGRLTIETDNVHIDADTAAARPELRDGPYVRLRVHDTGVGLTDESLDRAFDPFYTTKSAVAAGHRVGLGLASAWGIIVQADGSAELERRSEGGTTFTALLPAARLSAAPPGLDPGGSAA